MILIFGILWQSSHKLPTMFLFIHGDGKSFFYSFIFDDLAALLLFSNSINDSHHCWFDSIVEANFDRNNFFFLTFLDVDDFEYALFDFVSEMMFIRVSEDAEELRRSFGNLAIWHTFDRESQLFIFCTGWQ